MNKNTQRWLKKLDVLTASLVNKVNALVDGKKSFQCGLMPEDNPYDDQILRELWFAGYFNLIEKKE